MRSSENPAASITIIVSILMKVAAVLSSSKIPQFFFIELMFILFR
jgi:hypothetical protein